MKIPKFIAKRLGTKVPLGELGFCLLATTPLCSLGAIAPGLPMPLHCNMSLLDRWAAVHDWSVSTACNTSAFVLSWRLCVRTVFFPLFKPHLLFSLGFHPRWYVHFPGFPPFCFSVLLTILDCFICYACSRLYLNLSSFI